MRDQFVLTEEVSNIQQTDLSNYFIPNETEIRGKSDQDLARYLNGKHCGIRNKPACNITKKKKSFFLCVRIEITDSIQVSSENISDPFVFDKIRSFLKYATVYIFTRTSW